MALLLALHARPFPRMTRLTRQLLATLLKTLPFKRLGLLIFNFLGNKTTPSDLNDSLIVNSQPAFI